MTEARFKRHQKLNPGVRNRLTGKKKHRFHSLIPNLVK